MERSEAKRALIALALGLAAASPARAACGPDSTQTELNACAGAEFTAADGELNKLYKRILARLGEDKAPLVAAQRAWLAYRDAECAFVSSSVAGGSVEPMIHAGCLTDITRARIADFEGFLGCEEGDLSCPVPPG